MKERLLGLVLPASIVGVILGGSYGGLRLGFIPQPVWDFLWPSLVALGFLLLAIGSLLIGARLWLAPTITGFVVQLVGILLLAMEAFESPWEPLWVTLIAVSLAVLVILVIWLVSTLRARQIEKMMQTGVGAARGDQQAVAEIRRNMLEALARFKRAGLGRNAVYNFPWFLVIGRSGAGKTVAIKNSGLGLPVKDKVKGVSGTYTCDWMFTNSIIFLDTPGKWIDQGADSDDQQHWQELLRNLRKYRGRRPLDGIVAVVPADDLLSKSEQDLQEQASKIRHVVDLLQDELRFRFPVYLIVSKSDLVEGFVDFFKGLPVQRRNEILGWSNGDPNRGRPGRLIPQGFRRVLQRLQAFRLEILARIARTSQARRLFFFTEEFRQLERPLTMFTSVLFAGDPYHQPPVFRGFYFTSGTQEGSPLGQAMGNLARALGVRVSPPQTKEEEEPKRSYFLLQLFRDLMVGDQGLVGRTALHWWRSRRDTLMFAFMPAGLVACAFAASSLSFVLNRSTYNTIETEVPDLVRELKDLETSGGDIQAALAGTETLRRHHRDLTGFTLMRGFLMRRPGELADQTFDVFREQFTRHVLRPTLEAAQDIATDPQQTCTDRADVFYSIIWLRQGHRGEWSDDLRGLAKVWHLSDAEADRARRLLVTQFAYLEERAGRERTLLPGISLVKVADSLAEGCRTKGAGSALEMYQKFQSDCRTSGPSSEVTRCHGQLSAVLRYHLEDYEKLRGHLRGLRQDLLDLRHQEAEAEPALDRIKDIELPDVEANQCLRLFKEKVIPAIERYREKEEKQIDECKKEYRASGRRGLVAGQATRKQTEQMKDQADKLASLMEDYNARCEDILEGSQLASHILIRHSEEYRRVACMDQNVITPARVTRIPAPPQPTGGEGARERIKTEPPPGPPAPVARSGVLFVSARGVPGGFTLQGWNTQKQEWAGDIEFARSLPPAQQAEQLAPVRQAIDDFGRRYYQSWKGYLESLGLREHPGSVSGWLKALSTSPEWARLLRPAAQAVPQPGMDEEAPFDAFTQRLAGLQPLAPFVNAQLAEYQSLLGAIGRDLEACEKSSGFLSQYRSQVAAHSQDNTLVRARDWVERNAGSILVEGMLRPLLLRPLDAAESYIHSPDLTRKQWADLRSLYDAVAGAFPFAGKDAETMVELKDFIALLGGQSGLVPVLADAAGQHPIPGQARAWLDRAAPLSRALFDAGKDEPRDLQVRFTIDDPIFEPDKLQEDFRVDAIQIYLGEGSEFTWKAAEPAAKTKSLQVPLLGDAASPNASIAAMLAQRKGPVGRAFGQNYKESERMVALSVEGHWAPVRLLAGGLPAGAGGDASDSLQLTYVVKNIPYKKNEPGQLKLHVRAKCAGIGPLLDLVERGLPAPPSAIGEE